MNGPADAFGPMLEVMSWVGFVLGIPLVIVGWIVANRRCQWINTTAEVFEAGGYKGFRWIDSEDMPHVSLHDHGETQGVDVGTRIEIHFDHCHPVRWGLEPPRNDNPFLIIGWILVSVAILCTVAGFIPIMF